MYKVENMDFAKEMGDIPPEQVLLRWFNAHLKNAGHNYTVTNFSSDLQVNFFFFQRVFFFLIFFCIEC